MCTFTYMISLSILMCLIIAVELLCVCDNYTFLIGLSLLMCQIITVGLCNYICIPDRFIFINVPKTPRNERICLHCKTDNFSEIDDEQHLLLKCSRFSEIRIALFDHVRKSCPRIDTLNDENKFIYLLNSSGSTIKEVAKFLHSAYTARSA